MTTITLPPEIEAPLAEEARKQGTTPELLALDKLRGLFPTAPAHGEKPNEEGTLYDFLQGFIGVIDSGEHVPGGAQMSIDSGKKFAQGMVNKREEGHL